MTVHQQWYVTRAGSYFTFRQVSFCLIVALSLDTYSTDSLEIKTFRYLDMQCGSAVVYFFAVVFWWKTCQCEGMGQFITAKAC